ncbi:MAG: acyltransferase family protein [Terriglobales bacterium]
MLRGVAIMLVLGRHHDGYILWHRAGGIGVSLFFVLSGFLISGLLFSEWKTTAQINLSRFFVRRAFKIYPAYYFFLLSLAPFTYRWLKPADFFFMQSYLPYFWGHGWSLSVEEHFYVVLPLALALSVKVSPRANFRWIPFTAPVLFLVCLFVRWRGGHDSTIHTHAVMDALFSGVAISWLWHFRSTALVLPRAKHGLLIAGLSLLVPAFIFEGTTRSMASFGSLSVTLGFCCILIWTLNTRSVGKLKPLAWIGFYSYSIYLWHWPMAQMFQGVPHSFWLYVASSILIGCGMTLMIEAPLLRFRDRYFPRRAAPAHPANAHHAVSPLGSLT